MLRYTINKLGGIIMFDTLIKWYKTEKYASSLLFAIVGLLLFFAPDYSLSLVFGLISFSLIFKGLFMLIAYLRNKDSMQAYSSSMVLGIFYALAGLLLFLNYRLLIGMIPFVVGCVILVNGVNGFMDGFRLNKDGFSFANQMMIRGGLVALIGLLLMMNPLSTVSLTIRAMGLMLVVNALLEAFDGYRVNRWMH